MPEGYDSPAQRAPRQRALHTTFFVQSTIMTERIGILGGTFDPVHVGHLMDAVAARDQLDLQRVLLVVARDPWQKRDRVIAPAEVRYEMLVAAIDGVDGLEPSRIELERDGPTYTIDTVEQLSD